MKKKKLLTVLLPCIALLVLSAVLLTGCNNDRIYATLNGIVNARHDSISVKITTEQNGGKLTSTFDVDNSSGDKSVVNYSVENFTPIDPNTGAGGGTVTLTGSVELEDGNVTNQTGDKINVDFGDVTTLTLRFAKAIFDDVKVNNGIFTAKVTNPKAFMDSPSLVCTDMTVSFAYADSANYSITVNYTSANGAAVTINYTLA